MQIYEGRRTLRRAQVIKKTGISQATIFRLERDEDFPRHFLLTPRCAVWFEDEIDQWLDDRRAKAIATNPLAHVLYQWRAKDKDAKPLADDVRTAATHSLLGDA